MQFVSLFVDNVRYAFANLANFLDDLGYSSDNHPIQCPESSDSAMIALPLPFSPANKPVIRWHSIIVLQVQVC